MNRQYAKQIRRLWQTSLLDGSRKVNGATTTDQQQSSRFFSPTIGLAGFGVLLGWHFLILYYSFPMTNGMLPAEFVFIRQVALNATLGISFGLFGRLMSNLPQRDSIKSHTIAYLAMAFGTIGSIALFAGSILGIAWSVLAVILIGASEAVLMLFWLRFYTEASINYSGISLSASAVLGSLICFFTFHLTFDISVLILIILPAASGLLLINVTKGIPLRKNDPQGSGIRDWSSARKPYWKTTAQLMAMSLFFGVVQGCSSLDSTLLPAADPSTVLGATFAGIVLFLAYLKSKRQPNLGLIINFSLMIFMAGMMLLAFNIAILSQWAAFLIMTGFIFYFILTLIFIIDLCRTFDLDTTRTVGLNQALEYIMFAIGIIAGRFLWSRFENDALFPFVVSFMAIFVLCAIALFLTNERPPWEAVFYKPALIADKHPAMSGDNESNEPFEDTPNEADILMLLSERYSLTPREIEVFTFLSKGRNAEFIQNALFISNHTVKTHIYNIYKKMDIHSLQDLLDILDEEASRSEIQSCGTRKNTPL